MDRVARAIGDRGGATVVLDAGDDTSTGQPWEAFSLDSLDRAFDDLDRFGVAGNHDNGPFVARYLDDLGWTMLDGSRVDAPWGGMLLGVDDPRSSGLGNWRDETGLSFTEVGERLADAVCDGDRISTLLVHDANLGRESLARGCVDLVIGGHTHVQDGPDLVEGDGRSSGLHLHQRHDRRCGVRHRDRQQAAPRRRRHARDLPRRPSGRHPVGAVADRRGLRDRGVRRARWLTDVIRESSNGSMSV